MSQVYSTLVLCRKSLLTEYKFSRCWFPQLEITWLMASHKWSLRYTCSTKDCGNIVSRLRDLSSVFSAVWSVRVPSWSPFQGAWHDTLRVECARKSPVETLLWLALAPGSTWIALIALGSILDCTLITFLVSHDGVEFFGWNRALTPLRCRSIFFLKIRYRSISFENLIHEYLFEIQIHEYLLKFAI